MNPSPGPDIDVKTLLALRQDNDAVRLITDRLKVKEMGPADHIRTKHEVKEFVESGNESAAVMLLQRAAQRHELGQKLSVKIALRRSEHP